MLLYSVIILIVYIFIFAFRILSKDKNHLLKIIIASAIILPFWILLIYQNINFIIDKNSNEWLHLQQKITIKNNSKNIIKYRFYIQDSNKKWHYYYPGSFSIYNYKCYLPEIEQNPNTSNSLLIKTSNKTKFMLEKKLAGKKNNVLVFEIPESSLYIYNDDSAFHNYSFDVNNYKEFVFIISNFVALIASFLHLFKRLKKKSLYVITIIISIVSIIISTLFLINFIYLIFI